MAGLQQKDLAFHKNLTETAAVFLALEGDLPGKAEHWDKPQTDAGGAVRQSSSRCPRHEASLQVDMTSHNAHVS